MGITLTASRLNMLQTIAMKYFTVMHELGSFLTKSFKPK